MFLNESVLKRHYQWSTAQSIMDILKSAGFQALLAGGCVRDAFLGRRPNDLDIATNAKPEEVEALFDKTVSVGKAFGVIRVLLDGCDIEVATFRKDGLYLDGRRPESVEFSTPQEDAQRRDFTINALFYDPDRNEVLDFVGGIQDLQQKVLRTVGRPEDRFAEDQLRMLRAVRFSAQIGFDIEDSTMQAIQKAAFKIDNVSGERIREELEKFFLATYKVSHLATLKNSGLESALFPKKKGHHWIDVPIQSFKEGLALYFREDLDSPVLSSYLAKLKLSSDDKKFFEQFQRTYQQFEHFLEQRLGPLLQSYAQEGVRFAFQVKSFELAEKLIEDQGLSLKITQIHQRWLSWSEQLPVAFVTGKDLMEVSDLKGKALGEALNELYWEQLEGVIISKEEAIAKVTLKKG